MDFREKRKTRILKSLYTVIALIVILGAVWLLRPVFESDAEARRAREQAARMAASEQETEQITQIEPEPEPAPLPIPEPEVLPEVEVAKPVEIEIKPVAQPVAMKPVEVEPVKNPEPVVTEPEKVEIPKEPEPIIPVDEIRIPRKPTIIQSYIDTDFGWSSSDVGSEDFFSDFFVSGSDMVYEDGLQNPYLYINDEYYGSVEVDMRSNVPYLSKKSLSSLLSSLLEKTFFDSFFSLEDEFISQEYLEQHGVGFNFDANVFAIYLTFSPQQLPQESISLSSTTTMLSRNNANIEGVKDIDPATFSFASNISVFGNLSYGKTNGIQSGVVQLSTSNMISFSDLATDFSMSVSKNGIYFGGFQSYFDFIDDSLRFTFGVVPVYSALESSNPLGFSLEKNYSYGLSTRKNVQFEQEIVVEEDSNLVVWMNSVKTYVRHLNIGQYKLKDFTFIQGSNKVEIWLVPDSAGILEDDYETIYQDPNDTRNSLITKNFFGMGYDSSLLAKGESLWKFTYSFPSVADDGKFGGFHYIDFNKNRLVTKFTDFSVSLENSIGVTHTFTLSNVAALSGSQGVNGDYRLRFLDSFSVVKAFNYGTLNLSGQVQIAEYTVGKPFDADSLTYSLSMSNKFNNPILSPLGLSVSYDSSSRRLSLNTGYSMSFDILRAGLSGSFGYDFKNSAFSWSASLSLSGSFAQGLSMSAGISTSSTMINETIPFRVSIGLSMVLGSNASMSAKTDLSTMDAGFSWKPFGSKRSSVQMNISGIDFADSILNHTLALSYAYSGDLIGLSLRQQFTNRYQSFNTTVSMNTALVFADGRFGMAKSVSGSYLLVHPAGLMKDSSISIGRATASSSSEYKKIFGNVLYSGLSLYQHNGIVIFGSESSMFGSGGTFLIGMTPRPRQGFVQTIAVSPTVTMSAILKKATGEPFVQYSSPIYLVDTVEQDGKKSYSLTMTDNYLFTDENGRFIQSNLEPGLYCIDLDATADGDTDKVWYGLFFRVPELDEKSQVVILEDYQVGQEAEHLDIALDLYSESILLHEVSRVDETVFWDTIFSADTIANDWSTWSEEDLNTDWETSDGLTESADDWAFSDGISEEYFPESDLNENQNDVEYVPQMSTAP